MPSLQQQTVPSNPTMLSPNPASYLHNSTSPSNSTIPSSSNSSNPSIILSSNHESNDPQTPTNPSDPSTKNPNLVDPDPAQPEGESSNSGGEEMKEEEGEEAEGECGFCLFMKAGGCKETFVAWETCVDEAEKKGDDIATKCMEATTALKKCMEAHADYYEPILKAEKAAHKEAMRELEKEKAAQDSKQNLESKEDSKQN